MKDRKKLIYMFLSFTLFLSVIIFAVPHQVQGMDENAAKKEISELRAQVNYHNYRYYVLDSPEISDQEYDALFKRLKALEEEFPHLITPDSPTQRVGAPSSGKFNEVTHTIPMLSLEKAFSNKEVIDFDAEIKRYLNINGNVEYVVEPKIDGLAVELVYENGSFKTGSTRGDGIKGEDVTLNLKTIKSIPLFIDRKKIADLPDYFEVRGEVYISKNDFTQLNKEREEAGESLFANPRNAAAGSLRQPDPSITANRPLEILCYGIGTVRGMQFDSHEQMLSTLRRWGFRVSEEIKTVSNINSAVQQYERLNSIRDSLGYQIDGVVIKVNSMQLQQKLGNQARSPRWALAAKFKAKQENTIVLNIILSVGRFGTITPIAELKPVTIGGVEVKRASLHNEDEIRGKDIRIGDTVVVERSGDVIPYVVKVVKSLRPSDAKEFVFPEKCPSCGADIVKSEGESAYRCISLTCPDQQKERIRHFTDKGAFDIKGLGEKSVEQFVSARLLRDVSDIFYMKEENILKLDKWAEKSTANLMKAIADSRTITLNKFIYSLGIRNVGELMAKRLASRLKRLDNFYTATEDDLKKIDGVGTATAKSIVNFFADGKNKAIIDRILAAGVNVLPVIEKSEEK